MASIFVSYRRDDSEDVAGRIFDELVKHFSRDEVFMDVDSIPDGADFVTMIHDKVNECQVMLVVIGRNWIGQLPAQKKRRIDNPQDFVRLEVEAALRRGMPVIPLLVSRAAMPTTEELPPTLARLTVLNARPIRSRDFHNDMEALVAAIEMQRATWLALEAERAEQQRQRESHASARLETDTSPAREILGGFGSLSERQLVTLAGTAARFFLTALRSALGRAFITFMLFAVLAGGGAFGLSYALLHQSAFAAPTYLAVGWSALITGAFAGLLVIFVETIRAMIRAVELIIAEAERSQVEALREREAWLAELVEDARALGRGELSEENVGVIERSVIGDGALKLPRHHSLLDADQNAVATTPSLSDASDSAVVGQGTADGARPTETSETSLPVEQTRRDAEEP